MEEAYLARVAVARGAANDPSGQSGENCKQVERNDRKPMDGEPGGFWKGGMLAGRSLTARLSGVCSSQ